MKNKIVIVEDNLIIQELHKHYLQNLGHEVVACFENGQDVIDFFKENTADLILMDIRLGDGIDGIKASQQISEMIPIPVVFASANSDDSTYNRAISSNMKGFLSKPISISQLEEALQDLSNLNDSILYAERIQKSFFPQSAEITSCFGDNIYVNRPKDVISGDFCFFQNTKENVVAIIGDCTGHGVPGALLSILCAQLASSSFAESSEINTIVDSFKNKLQNFLARGNSEYQMQDSLDYIIFSINKKKSIIEIMGLNRPFIYFDSQTGKHNIMQISDKEKSNKLKTYAKDFSIKYNKNDLFYFFSDGISDQFGGEKDKKLTLNRFVDFLDSIVDVKFLFEKQLLLNLFLRKWQGNKKQTDDIILLAICPANLNEKSPLL